MERRRFHASHWPRTFAGIVILAARIDQRVWHSNDEIRQAEPAGSRCEAEPIGSGRTLEAVICPLRVVVAAVLCVRWTAPVAHAARCLVVGHRLLPSALAIAATMVMFCDLSSWLLPRHVRNTWSAAYAV